MTDDAPATGPPTIDAAVASAFDLVQAEPLRAEAVFRDALGSPGSGDPARVLALWGLGRVAHDRGAIEASLIAFSDAVALAVDTGDLATAAAVRVSWAASLQAGGDTSAALEQIEAATPYLDGAALGRALTQRGLVHWNAGDRDAALADYEVGLPLLVEGGERVAALRSYANRGVVLLQLGRFDEALADFETTHTLADELGQAAQAAGAVHNIAYLHGRSGRPVLALRGYAEARDRYAQVGSLERQRGALDIDECDLLLDLGLGADAVPIATRVVHAARAGGNAVQLAEALLMAARAHLMAGEAELAGTTADEAVQLFVASGRTAWAAQARYWVIAAAAAHGGAQSSHGLLRQFVRLRKVADQLDGFGWSSEAADVRVLTGRLAMAAGRADVAATVLRAASGARRHRLARVRAEAWHATALLHIAEGDRTAARRALVAGLRAVEEHRASLGAAELRSGAGRLGAPLAADGLRLAFDEGDPATLLEWAERGRAGALGAPSPVGAHVVPDELRAALREARHRLGEAEAPDDDLEREVARLEAAVSRASRERDGVGQEAEVFRAPELRRRLGGTTLVEYLEVDGRLCALVCGERRLTLVELGPSSVAGELNDHLAFALRRLAAVRSGPSADRALAAFVLARRELDEVLFGPLRPHLGAGPLVVVPTGALHDVLWGALPTAEGAHGVAVAPSAAWWARGGRSIRSQSVLLVAGPHLAHADAEVLALTEVYPDAVVLRGADATVEAVLTAMEGATLVHIAAHGVFRTDNPMFSTLQLFDGPLFVHELDGLARVPDTVVLTACSSGRSGLLPGDELLGTTAALMALGVGSVIAPLVPVSDAASARVALALHRAMRDGHSPASAMATVLREAVAAQQFDVVAAAGSFTCVAARAGVEAG